MSYTVDTGGILLKSSSVSVIADEKNPNKANIIVEPLSKGFGSTLGVAMRRVLLSYISGYAITSCKIEGASHEFCGVNGVKEDIYNIILNLKNIIIKLSYGLKNKSIHLKCKGPFILRASELEVDGDVVVLNKDLIICEIEEDIDFSMVLEVNEGVGYSDVSSRGFPLASDSSISAINKCNFGKIGIDAMFSPVKKVSYSVENSRIGEITDYNKLVLAIETNGVISPEDAVESAASIITSHLSMFLFASKKMCNSTRLENSRNKETGFDECFLAKVEDLDLSVRSHNCLKCENIIYVGDLVQNTEADMLRTPNLGRRSLNEMKQVLTNMGLRFGMKVEGWPPSNISSLSKKVDDDDK